MRPAPLQPTRYDATNPQRSFTALEGSVQTALRSVSDALLTLEPTELKTGTYTARPRDLVLADPTSAAFEVIIPDPVPGGPWVMVKKVSSSTNAVTLRPLSSSVTIDGSSTLALPEGYDQALLVPVSSTLWGVMAQPTAPDPTLAEVLAEGNITGGTDIDVTAGDDLNFLGSIDIRDGDVTFVSSDGTSLILDQGKLKVGDTSTPQIYLDADNSATTARIMLTAPSGATAGYDLILEGGAAGPSGNQTGGDLRLKGGNRSGSGGYGDVVLEHYDGTIYLTTDVTNAKVVIHRNKLTLGTSAMAGDIVLDFINSSSSSGKAFWYDGNSVLHVGDGTVRAYYDADSNGSGFGFQGHLFLVESSNILEIRSNGITMVSSKVLNFDGNVIIQRSLSNAITYDGTTMTLAGILSVGAISATSLALGTDPADTGTIALPNAGTVYFEASPTGTDVRAMTVDSSERLILGEDTNCVDVQLRAATSVELYAGGNLIAQAQAGELELSSGIKLDWNGGTAALSRSGTNFATFDGTTITLSAGATTSIAIAPAASAYYGVDTGYAHAWLVNSAQVGLINENRFEINSALLRFGAAVSAPVIEQGAVVDATGQHLYIQAQSNNSATLAAGSLILRGGINSGAGASGSVLVQYGASTVWTTRTTELELGSGIALDWAGGTATISRAGASFLTYDGTTLALTGAVTATSLALGTDPADAGTLRMPNAGTIMFEASPAGTDVQALTLTTGEILQLGEDTNAVDVHLRAATSVEMYAGGTLIAQVQAGELELASTKAVDFAGDILITRQGANVFTASASAGTLYVAGTAMMSFSTQVFGFVSTVTNPVFRQGDDATNSATGDTLSIRAQDCTGTTTTGGALDIRPGTGTSTNGLGRLLNGSTQRFAWNGTGIGFYATTPVAQPADQVAVTDNTAGTASRTWAALPDPANSPATADALRDDLVTNVLPILRNWAASAADWMNDHRTNVFRNLGLTA